MTDKEKEVIRELNHPLYTVEFLEEWKDREDNVFANAPAALQAMGAKGYYEAVKQMTQVRKSTGKQDISGREVFEGDVIENPDGFRMEIKYGLHKAYCPEDKMFMDGVGFYAIGYGTADMPIGCLEDYAKVIGDIYINPDLKIC